MNTPLNPGFYSKITCVAGSTFFSPGQTSDLINQDRLQGYPANYFLLKTAFPVDLTGILPGDILVYNGTEFVPDQLVVPPSVLEYFVESETLTSTVLATVNTLDFHLKNKLETNFVFGPAASSITGKHNYVASFDDKGQTITGDLNISLGLSAYIVGAGNIILNSPINIYGTNNICFNQTIPIGNGSLAASDDNFIIQSTFDDTFIGSDNIFLYNDTLTISNNSTQNNVMIRTATVELYNTKNTGINLYNSTINANNTFASGDHLDLLSDYVVGFGQYALVENGNAVSKMAFFIGNGSISQRSNAVTVWRSGAVRIGGALKIGSVTSAETAVTEGMIRENSGYLQMYRSGAWSNQLSTFNPTISDQATLDGYDSTDFILKTEFPLSLNTLTLNDVLIYNGTSFVNKAMSFITGVGDQDTVDGQHASAFVTKVQFPLSTATPTNNQILQYNTGTSLWTPVALPNITATTPLWDVIGFDPNGTELPQQNTINRGVVYDYSPQYRVRPGDRTSSQTNSQVAVQSGKLIFEANGLYNVGVNVSFNATSIRTDRPLLLVLADITDQNNVIRLMEQIQTPSEIDNLAKFPSALYFVSFAFTITREVTAEDNWALFIYSPDTTESGTLTLTPIATATKVNITELTYAL